MSLSLRRFVVVPLVAVLLIGGHGSAFAVDNLLRITEVMSKPSDRYAAPDWFELTNYGTQDVDLTFYAVDDNTFAWQQSSFLNSATTDPIVIKPGESVVFVEGDTASVQTFRSAWALDPSVQVGYYGGSGLSFSSGGDGTTVFDELEPPNELPGPFGGLIRVSYPAATTGRSFFWDYTATGALGSTSAGTVTPTTDEDPFSMSWTYTLSDGVTTETQYATPGKANAAAQAIGILVWSGNDSSGGAGNWTSATPLTWQQDGTPVAWNASSIATFPATNPTAGTVTLTEPTAAAELSFGKTGYTIASSDPAHTLTLNSGIVSVDAGITTTINAPLAGPVGLTKTGAGTLLLGGSSQYAGLTSITFGELRLTGSGQLPASSVVSIGLTGVLNLNGSSTAIGGLQGLGDVQMGSGNLTIGITDDTDREHNGNLAGSGDVIIDSAGAGEQRFDLRSSTASKRKSYSGRTIVREGSLRVSLESIPDETSAVEIEEGGRLKLSTSVTTGEYLFGQIGANSFGTTVSLLGGTLTNAEGEITALANDVVFGGSVASRLEVNEENTPTPENPNLAELRLLGALSGSGTVAVGGNGTVTLGVGTSNFSGSTTSFSGLFSVGDPLATGTTTLLNLAGSIGTGSVDVNATGAVQAAPGVPLPVGSLTLAGGELRLDADSGSVTTFAQTAVTITGPSSIAVRRADDVAAELSPSYALPLTFSGGGLTITAPTRAATDASAYDARPTFSGAVTLAQDATVSVVNPASGSNRTTFSGVIADGGAGRSLTKGGGGTLVLAAANTYGGATLLQEGTLALAAAGSVAASPRIEVAAGATFDVSAKVGGYAVPSGQTLAGNGTVDGSVAVGVNATLSPGASPGTLTMTGDTAFGGGGNYNWQVLDFAGGAGSAGGWDLLSIGGTLDVTASSGDPFAINLWSLSSTGPDVSGAAAGWNGSQSGSWRIATAAGGITGFAADKFTINTAAANGTAGFANAFGGDFSLSVSGNDLNLVYTVTGAPSGDIVIDVPSGSLTQSQAGYAQILSADSVTKTGSGTLVFDAANAHTGPTSVSAGTLRVAQANALASTAVSVSSGATLEIASGVTMKAPSVTLAGGTLSADAIAVNAATGIATLAINAGALAGGPAVVVGPGGLVELPENARVSVAAGSLEVDQASGGGAIDLGGGQITIAAGGISAADLRADIIAGRNGGVWTGTAGITSATAAATPGTRGVGYTVAGDGSAKVSFAAPGDTNLDGLVNFSDIQAIINGGRYGQPGATGVWAVGDFNYDGLVNFSDIQLLLNGAAYGQPSYFSSPPSSGLAFGGGGGIVTVPEPGTLAWLGLAAAGVMLGLRRRR